MTQIKRRNSEKMCIKLIVTCLVLIQTSEASTETGKLGRCPDKGLLEPSQCIDNLLDECASDSDCAGAAKCCSTGCKNACVLPDLSTCQRIHVEYQKRARALGTNVSSLAPPRCHPAGKFEPVQCNGTACWCVDGSGFEVAGTRARALELVDCKNPRPCAAFNCRMLCPYEFQLDTDGCPLCQCRDPCKGIKCPGSQACQLDEVPCEKEPCAPVPTCKQARSLDSLCPLGLPMTLPGGDRPYLCGTEAGKPRCPELFDCIVSAGADYGVCCAAIDLLKKPGSCPVSSPGDCGVPCGNDLACSGADKCCASIGCGNTCVPPQNLTVCRQHQAFTELLNLHEREGRGYTPQCTSDGIFEPRQCSRNGLVCWCVDSHSGATVRGSIGPALNVRCNVEAGNLSETGRADCGISACARTCQYGYKTDETGCQLCECENPCMNFKCQDGFKCEKVPEDGCNGSRCPVKPQCNPIFVEPCSQGPHLRNGVSDQPAHCTVGSKFSCPSGYNCISSIPHNANFCCPKKDEEQKERHISEMMPTVCQVMRQLSDQKKRNLEQSGMELVIKNPKCTPAGEFDSLQCSDDDCWCVDEFGTEVQRTRGPKSVSRDCQRSRNDIDCEGESMCRLGCDFGFVIDTNTGCPKCECRDGCESVNCPDGMKCQVATAPCEEADCPKLPFCMALSRRSIDEEVEDESLENLSCPGGDVVGKVRTCRVRGRSLVCPSGFGCYSNSSNEGSLGICCPLTNEIPAKLGQCPFLMPFFGLNTSCDIGCATDLDCEGSSKCCSNGCGTECIAPLLKTGCELEKDIVSHRAREYGIPANRIYLPECNNDGNYKKIQCHPGTRVCWCVDTSGRELAGTRTPPGIKPTCDVQDISEICDPIECELGCIFGYSLDTAGCPMCKCKNPCEKVRCGETEICKMVQLNCISDVCPPLPLCVPRKDRPCSIGKALQASSGQQVQCGPVGETCPSSHRCQLSPFGEYAACCPKPRDVCTEPLATGNCNSSLPRWFFNTKSNRCETFRYSGCGSNLNNFESEQDCKATCPVLTSCEKLREKNIRMLEKQKKVVFLPKCKEGGEFETVQCLDELGICWCVDKHGEPVKGTLTRGKPICSVRQARQHSVDKMICEENVIAHVCDKSLCENKVCIADPTSRCKINPCGGCKVEFYDARGTVVNCSSGLSKCQAHIQEIVNNPNWYRQELEYAQNRDAEVMPNFYTDFIRMSQSHSEVKDMKKGLPRQKRQSMIDLSEIDDEIFDLMAMESKDHHEEFPQILTPDGDIVESHKPIDAMPEFSGEMNIFKGAKIRYAGDAIKAGECPAVRQPSFLRLLAQATNQCVDKCVSDADCPGALRCCSSQCGLACQLPILPKTPVTKPGQCPVATRFCKSQSEKKSLCRRDWDCPSDSKCCDTGCGNVCVQPEDAETTASALYLVPPRCTEAGDYSPEQRQGDLAWCVTEDGSPVQGSLTRGFVRCASNGTIVERLALGPVCPSPNQAPKVCSTECQQASCLGHPEAVCVADPCNGCRTSFYTIEGDEVTCEPLCAQKVRIGFCRASLLRWHFNSDTQMCDEFYFGGCGGNDNNFQSLEECQENCKRVDRCSLPKNVGTCGKQLKRWLYNPTERKCEEFQYTGCGGNANNFITKEECEMTCPDLVMCPKLPDTAGQLSVCSRSEVCEQEGCPDEDLVCTADPCTCSPIYKNRKGERVECRRYPEENFLADASSTDELPENLQTVPPIKIIPAEVLTETEEEKIVRNKSKQVETEVIRMYNPAQEFLSRLAAKGPTAKPLKKKKPKSMEFDIVKATTRCQKMRQRMMEEKSSFVVDCDKTGRFAPTQCYMGTPAVCWCVDESGNQLKDTTLFMSGNRTCHHVPVKAVNVSLAIPMHEGDHPETDLIQKQIDEMLTRLNAQIELTAADMNTSNMIRMNFTLIGDNKIDVADHLEEMVRNGDLQLQMGDEIMPADFTSSRFVHIAGSPVIRQQRKIDMTLDNREIIAEAIEYEIPYFAIVVTMCVVSSVVICALIISLLLYRKRMTGEYPKNRGVPLAYGSYHSGGGKREDVVQRGFPRVGLDEKDFASIKVKALSPVLPRFMRHGNTESMKL